MIPESIITAVIEEAKKSTYKQKLGAIIFDKKK
jgi:hypothetical protein